VKDSIQKRNWILCLCLLFIVALSHAASSRERLTVNPSAVGFGNVAVGSTATQSLTLQNVTWRQLTITSVSLSGTGFSVNGLNYPVTLASGQSVTCTVMFTPQAAASNSGSISVTFNESYSWGDESHSWTHVVTATISGTGVSSGVLVSTPSSLSFGSVQVGNSSAIWETVTNSGSATVNISQASVSGAGYTISGLTPPLSLTSGQSITFGATFSPQTGGTATGSITLTSSASNPTLSISLVGNGTAAGQLSVSPSSFNLGNVAVGSSASTSATLSNTSTTSVTLSSVALSNSEFAVSGISLPLTVSAGQSVPFTATFTPQASGTTSATASFVSNASNSPSILSLSGDGTAPPPQYSVALSWAASASQNINGYNVYRSSNPGGPYTRVNSALNSNTAYTDNSVTAGQTYYYVTTAVNSSDQESAYSNQATAVVP